MGTAEIFGPLYWVIVAAIFVAMVVELRGLFGALWAMLADMWAARDRPIWRRQPAPRGPRPRGDAAPSHATHRAPPAHAGGTRRTAAGPDPRTGQDRRYL